MQFGELKRELGGISAKILTEQLRQLEAAGILTNTKDDADYPVTSYYEYTVYGKSLIPILDSIGNWGLLHNERTYSKH